MVKINLIDRINIKDQLTNKYSSGIGAIPYRR